MTKKELANLANEIVKDDLTDRERFRYCKAHICWSFSRGYTVLVSFETPVAIFSERTKTLYALQKMSHTTTQHIRKFIYDMSPERVIYLYERPDKVVEIGKYYTISLKPFEFWLEENEDEWRSFIYE